jgi:hypothetical protein
MIAPTMPARSVQFAAAVILALAIASPAAAAAAGGDVKAVKATFKTYQSALLKRNGTGAAAVMNRGTIAYYQRMRDLAVAGKPDEVKKLPLLDKLMVVRMRHQVALAQLKAMDGKAAFGYGVSQGWVGDSVAKVGAGPIEITGDRASLTFMVGGEPTPAKLALDREDGAWRIDLLSLFELSGAGFKNLHAESGKSEDDFILELVQKVSGKPVPATIWNPPS